MYQNGWIFLAASMTHCFKFQHDQNLHQTSNEHYFFKLLTKAMICIFSVPAEIQIITHLITTSVIG